MLRHYKEREEYMILSWLEHESRTQTLAGGLLSVRRRDAVEVGGLGCNSEFKMILKHEERKKRVPGKIFLFGTCKNPRIGAGRFEFRTYQIENHAGHRCVCTPEIRRMEKKGSQLGHTPLQIMYHFPSPCLSGEHKERKEKTLV